MRNLQSKHTGRYYCLVETDGQSSATFDLYIKVQSAPGVYVKSSSVSGHKGDNVSVQCFYTSGYQKKKKQWCRIKDHSCYTEKSTDTSQNPSVQISDDGGSSFTVLMTGLRLSDSGWYFCSDGEALNPVHLTVTEAEPASSSALIPATHSSLSPTIPSVFTPLSGADPPRASCEPSQPGQEEPTTPPTTLADIAPP
ncbi:unnamed protein product [Leuciscus chuanchicus]